MSEKITFQELIDSIAEETNNSKKFTHDFLKDLVSVINSGLEQDGSVNIAGFGKFKLRRMEEREGYNPQTGEKMTIDSHNKVVFKPYKDLRELVNAPYSDMESELVEEEEPEAPQEVTGETSESEEVTAAEEKEEKEEKDEQGFIPTGPPPTVKSDVEEEETGEEQAPWDKGEEEEEDTVIEEESQEDPFGLSASDTESTEEEEEDVVEYQAPEQEEREPSPLDEHLSRAKEEQEQKAGEEAPEPEEEEEAEPEPEPLIASETQPEDHPQESFLSKLRQKQPAWVWGAAAVIVLLIIVLLVLYMGSGNGAEQPSETIASTQPHQQDQTEEVTPQPEPQSQETQPAAPAESQSEETTGQTPRQEEAPEEPRQLQQNDFVNRSVSRGQTLWGLAEKEYEDPYLWPWIYDANKETIRNPDIILIGQTLSIPVPDESNNGLSSADSLEVAIGYVETYRWYKNNGSDQAKFYLWAAKLYDQNVFDHITQPIDEDDLAFANRVR